MSSMIAPIAPLAHAGEGAGWQALVTVLAAGIAVVFVLAMIGRIRLETAGDLVLPLAAVAIVSSLAPIASAALSDAVAWALPAGAALLLGLLVAALSRLELGFTSPLALGAIAVAVIAAVVLQGPLTDSLHPPVTFLPQRDDGLLAVTGPEEGATVEAGTVPVTVELTGATVGPCVWEPEREGACDAVGDVPDDPEELGLLVAILDNQQIAVVPNEDCTVDSPCSTVTFDLDVERGEHRLLVEFRAANNQPFGPAIYQPVISFTAE